jgi:hypothetical protein
MFRSRIDALKKSILCGTDGKIFFRLVEMLKLKPFDTLFGIKEALIDVIMMFVFSVLLEDIHIRSRPEAHVNDFELQL